MVMHPDARRGRILIGARRVRRAGELEDAMAATVLFDATRLVTRTHRDAPTGVDRVCLAYAEWLLGLEDVRIEPVRSRRGDLVSLDRAWFSGVCADLRRRWSGSGSSAAEQALVDVLTTSTERRKALRAAVPSTVPSTVRAETRRRVQIFRRLLASSTLRRAPSKQTYINVGHTGLDQPGLFAALAQDDVRSIVMIHDLIPISHPEYCRPGDAERHRRRVSTTLRYADAVLVNSRYTASTLAGFAAAHDLPCPPIEVAYLGLDPVFLRPGRVEARTPYFVHVGTIEARKNLAFLLTVWRRMAELDGPAAPQLVLVGRHGWENEAVLDLLERAPRLQSLVHHVADLSDSALVRLMSGARAVLAPSSVEGFDLPSLEASALGTPLIASDIDVHRELVPHARLVDPIDGPGWLAAIREAAAGRLTAAAAPIPDWAGHFEVVARVLGVDSPVGRRTPEDRALVIGPPAR
jgi:glycosyltransferase involved in cell wall biosynthesis